MNRKIIACVVAGMFLCITSQVLAIDAVGGGFSDRGIMGKWYANSEFKGKPAFERKDARIQFDWGTDLKPGGSTGDGLEKLGVDNYSVRWTGKLIPRYSEKYTFYFTADDGVRMKIKSVDETDWTTIIDFLNKAGEHKGEFTLKRGVKYDIKIDYLEKGGPAKAILEWSGKSFPREIIDSVVQMTLNHTYTELLFTDAIKCGRSEWECAGIDENGWPTGDGEFIFSEILTPYNAEPLETGTMRLSFNGSADITTRGNCDVISNSVKYAPACNTTTALIRGLDKHSNVAVLILKNTTRTGKSDGPGGVTNIKLMRPVKIGGGESFSENTIFHPVCLKAYEKFTGIRFQRVNDQAREWKERTPADYPYQKNGLRRKYSYNERYANGDWNLKGNSKMSHENEIMLCNTLGNDYYISTPHLASLDYIRNLALLIKYGSDENGEPYMKQVANPAHPPLNPNLRVYLELSNELWNWASAATYAGFYDLIEEVLDMHKMCTPDFKLLNYDEIAEKGGMDEKNKIKERYPLSQRWWVFKTAKYSNEFRKVFGDNVMPMTSKSPRIRPLFGWQYNDTSRTCSNAMDFMEQVLNNKKYVKTPHPPNYYIYAGGGAGYYSAKNKFGLINDVPKEGDFESPAIKSFEKSPELSGWAFKGDSGICRGGLNMPPVQFGKQAGYLNGKKASISFTFTAPEKQKSPYYAVNYRAVLPQAIKWSYKEDKALQISINGKNITYDKGRGTQPLPWTKRAKWNRVAWWVGSWYFSNEFKIEPGEKVTIAFTSLTDKSPVFIDKITMTSLDAFYASEMPAGGAAMGQGAVKDKSYGCTIMGDGRWAATFGLEYMTYEHGWSAGGDAGDTPIQIRAKYYDKRAADSVVKAMDIFTCAGGFNATFGTYAIWPSFHEPLRIEGALNIDKWPLVEGMNRVADSLPPNITNGLPVPGAHNGRLWSANLNIWKVKYDNLKPGQWLSYNFVVPKPGKYKLAAILEGGGRARISVNGSAPVVVEGAANGILTSCANLKYGINSVRITCLSGKIAIVRVICASAGISDEKLIKIRGKYATTPKIKPVSQNRLFCFDDFGDKAVRLSEYTGGTGWTKGFWHVQKDLKDISGYEIKTENPLHADKGGYAVGGQRYRSSGRCPDSDKIPGEFVRSVNGKNVIGVPGSMVFLSFSIRLDKKPDKKILIGWSKSPHCHVHNDYLACVTVKNAKWTLCVKNDKDKWEYKVSNIPALIGKSYNMVIKVDFNEYGSKVALYIDTKKVAEIDTYAEILCRTFVFYPGSTSNAISIDNLKVGDSLQAVGYAQTIKKGDVK